MARPTARPQAETPDYAARPASPRPPERIDTLPQVARPAAPPAKPAAASLADAGVKPLAPARAEAPVKPAAAAIADAGIKPAAKTAPVVHDLTVKAALEPKATAAVPERAPAAPAAKAPKAEPAKAEPKAKETVADGQHRCDDCGKTEEETTFPRKGDWVSRVCRACRKTRGLRP
jgi:hypothetical protein